MTANLGGPMDAPVLGQEGGAAPPAQPRSGD
jgi:hypothetical protein